MVNEFGGYYGGSAPGDSASSNVTGTDDSSPADAGGASSGGGGAKSSRKRQQENAPVDTGGDSDMSNTVPTGADNPFNQGYGGGAVDEATKTNKPGDTGDVDSAGGINRIADATGDQTPMEAVNEVLDRGTPDENVVGTEGDGVGITSVNETVNESAEQVTERVTEFVPFETQGSSDSGLIPALAGSVAGLIALAVAFIVFGGE